MNEREERATVSMRKKTTRMMREGDDGEDDGFQGVVAAAAEVEDEREWDKQREGRRWG